VDSMHPQRHLGMDRLGTQFSDDLGLLLAEGEAGCHVAQMSAERTATQQLDQEANAHGRMDVPHTFFGRSEHPQRPGETQAAQTNGLWQPSQFLKESGLELEILAQNGTGSSSKTEPPGVQKRVISSSKTEPRLFVGSAGKQPLACSPALALVRQDRYRVRLPRRVKQRQALRRRNLPRDNSADGVPMALCCLPSLLASGGSSLAHRTPEPMPGKISGVWGQSPQHRLLAAA
jgi:hypothetical protein